MEQFIRKFKPTADQALALRTINALSDIWNCGHRRYDCMYRGQCVVQNIGSLAALALTSEDHALAERIIDVAGVLGSNRSEVRVQVAACAQRNGPMDLGALQRESMDAVAYVAESLGMVKADHQNEEDQTRSYVDDSRTLFPHLYVAMNGDATPEVVDSLAVGNVLYLFHDDFQAVEYVFQRDPRALPSTNHYLAWAPNAPRYGEEELVMWVAYFHHSTRPFFDDSEMRTVIARNIEADLNFHASQATRRGGRLYFQRFGREGQGVADVDAMYQRQLQGRTLLEHYLARANTYERLFFPSLLLRGWIAGVYTEAEMHGWFAGAHTCQLCYAAAHTAHRRVLSVDVRTAEETGSHALRSLRPLRHGGEDLAGIRSQDMQDNEMLTRQGDHWCATVCRTSREAVYVTSTMMHRFLRGRGIGHAFLRALSSDAIARCYLHWLPEKDECIVLFRLLAYAQRLYSPPSLLRLGAWTDLGVFFREMFREVQVSEASARSVHSALLALVRYHVHLIAQHGYTRPRAPPARPHPIRRR
uniref:Non-structural protein NS1 n=1 Tax=Kemerovo virus TaxID=40064 RepID=A0A5S9H7E1_9REOV|nr:nonstructural protein 1 [Kemerovo virus]